MSRIRPGAAAAASLALVLAAGASAAARQLTPHPGRAGHSWMSPAAKSSALAYVADFEDSIINVYAQSDGTLLGRLAEGVSAPFGLASDAHGNLYVAQQNFQNCYVFPKGATQPSLIMFDSGTPFGVAVGQNGSVYVAENGLVPGIDVFPKKTSNPSYTIVDPSFAAVYAVYVDASGNVYAGGIRTTGGGQVVEFPAGSHGPGTNLGLTGLGTPFGLLTDKKGDLLVGDYSVSVIDVYKPGATKPSRQIAADNVGFIAFNRAKDSLWVPAFTNVQFVNPNIGVLAYPAGTVTGSMVATGPEVALTGVALTPAASP